MNENSFEKCRIKILVFFFETFKRSPLSEKWGVGHTHKAIKTSLYLKNDKWFNLPWVGIFLWMFTRRDEFPMPDWCCKLLWLDAFFTTAFPFSLFPPLRPLARWCVVIFVNANGAKLSNIKESIMRAICEKLEVAAGALEIEKN